MKWTIPLGLKNFFEGTIAISLILSISVYAWARILFYEVPFTVQEDIPILLKLAGLSWLMIIGLKGSFYSLVAIGELLQGKISVRAFGKKWIAPFIILILMTIFITSCGAQSNSGIKKDTTTGLTTNWQDLEPAGVSLVMNGEVLNHIDIPIGEKFMLLNKNVSNLTEKNGKVSVGCSLLITDKQGNKILEEADLFKDKDVFDKRDVRDLKCTVSTGDTMQWEELYDVVVTFWDKFGPGKIVNKVTIRMIDIP